MAGTVTSPPSTANPKFKVGDRVFGLGDPNYATADMAGLQEYAILNAESSALIPEGFTDDEVVTFPVNALTSFAALFHGKGFGFAAPAPFPPSYGTEAKEKTILIVGGGSRAGQLAIQYAKLAGVGVVITLASAARIEELKELGATHVIDRHASQEQIEKQITEITGGERLEYVYDCVSWDFTFSISLLSETKPSKLLVLHPAEEAETQAKVVRPNAGVMFILGNSDFIQPATKQFWEALPVWIKEKKLAVGRFKVIEGMDLKAIEEGLDSYRDGNAVVPVVVHPNVL